MLSAGEPKRLKQNKRGMRSGDLDMVERMLGRKGCLCERGSQNLLMTIHDSKMVGQSLDKACTVVTISPHPPLPNNTSKDPIGLAQHQR